MHFTIGKDRYHEHGEMSDWCRKHFGPGKWIGEPTPKKWKGLPNWTIHSMFGNTTFSFKNEKDYAWFMIRWS